MEPLTEEEIRTAFVDVRAGGKVAGLGHRRKVRCLMQGSAVVSTALVFCGRLV
ncbi:hypothetical protein [Streptomyces sp. NPDC001020]